jgi:hypothetical protein
MIIFNLPCLSAKMLPELKQLLQAHLLLCIALRYDNVFHRLAASGNEGRSGLCVVNDEFLKV